ncbi:MAG TPA: HAMP domain-containing sensor histidine kinase [Candidatus Limnocylindrales bacterium]|nr:HAMP domain-containing sensor histidine kinase [Candidatus Limnocylindrales bacterium]
MPRSLTGRIVAAFVVVGLAVMLAVGAATFVALRSLHSDAAQASLADLADSLLPQVRQSIVDGDFRGTIEEVRVRLARGGTDVLLVTADGSLVNLNGSPAGGSLALDAATARGDVVQGAAVIDDERVVYAATILRARGTGPRAVAFVQPDRSGAQALADVGRSLPLVLLVGLAVGGPLAVLLARSVGRPLRRLASATADLPSGAHDPLPLAGPAEVRELTERFNAMAGELEASRARERELLAHLRHDLRTPLTVISGFAAALGDGTATGPDAERAAAAIADEAERLERLVAELGTIEALREGSAVLRPEQLDAATLIATTAERFGPRAEAAGVAIEAIASDAAPPFAADRVAVERILANLVENALRSAPPGGHVWLDARAVRSARGTGAEDGGGDGGGDAVALSVSDDGPGFPPGTTDRAFERFFRADPARSGSGSGLGLAIVRELAEAHGGWAYAENLAPRGARVGVVLPLVPSVTTSAT